LEGAAKKKKKRGMLANIIKNNAIKFLEKNFEYNLINQSNIQKKLAIE
jgi:hypothetical protein